MITLGPADVGALGPEGNATKLTHAVDLRPSGLFSVVAPLATSWVKSAVAANLKR
jgi:hypothetical protein